MLDLVTDSTMINEICTWYYTLKDSTNIMSDLEIHLYFSLHCNAMLHALYLFAGQASWLWPWGQFVICTISWRRQSFYTTTVLSVINCGSLRYPSSSMSRKRTSQESACPGLKWGALRKCTKKSVLMEL